MHLQQWPLWPCNDCACTCTRDRRRRSTACASTCTAVHSAGAAGDPRLELPAASKPRCAGRGVECTSSTDLLRGALRGSSVGSASGSACVGSPVGGSVTVRHRTRRRGHCLQSILASWGPMPYWGVRFRVPSSTSRVMPWQLAGSRTSSFARSTSLHEVEQLAGGVSSGRDSGRCRCFEWPHFAAIRTI